MNATQEILVGVDGSPGSNTAIRYAAAEAMRRGLDLHLVHIIPGLLPLTGLYPMQVPFQGEEFEEAGREVMAEAVALAQREVPADRVRGTVATGERVPALVEASAGAALVVLGADRAPTLERLTVGSTVGSVAARADEAVVVVPPDWHQRSTAGEVVVGIKSVDPVPLSILRAALEVASQRSATLRVVYVWELPAMYVMTVLGHLDKPGWAAAVEERIRTQAAELLAEYAGVTVEIEPRYGQPAEELVRLSSDAELLVIARRARAFPVGHFGSTGRALLRNSHGAVMVLPTVELPED